MFKTRFISMLALLMTAVTGAWADEQSESFTTATSGQVTYTGEHFTITGQDVDGEGLWITGRNIEQGAANTVTISSKNGENITRIEAVIGYIDEWDAVASTSGNVTGTYADGQTITISSVNATTVTLSSTLNDDGLLQFKSWTIYYESAASATVAVTGVTLAPTSATLTLGETETVTLIPTVLPDDATDKSVTWSSSNEAVATVTDGVVTAVAAGTATITVTTTDGAKTATCAVTVAAPAASTYTVTLKEGTEDATSWTIAPAEATTTGVEAGTEVKATYSGMKKVKSVKAVKKASAVPVTAITLNKTETSIKVGATETLSVTAVAPDNATDKTYTWKTSDETKATVDQDGKVTAVAAGTVNIYAEANDGSGVKGNCTVTVTPATITVTWNNDDITGSGNSFTKDGVTITANYIDFPDKSFQGGGTFTTTLGNFTKIEVTTGGWYAYGTGWSDSDDVGTWTGNASSVSFSGDIYGYGMGTTKLVFTIEP